MAPESRSILEHRKESGQADRPTPWVQTVMNLLIVGRGKVGRTLGRALRKRPDLNVSTAGRQVPAVRVRQADVVVLAVPDQGIRSVAEALAPHLSRGSVVLHCAGARDPDELEACAAQGAATGVMHPLVSFADPRRGPALAETTFTVSGDDAAIRAARQVAKACGARALVGPISDPAYHAAAALVANGAVALAHTGVLALVRLGFERRKSERGIAGLLRSVADNIDTLGVPTALTGPIARGDAGTVQRHRAALRRIGPRFLATYDRLSPVIVECARAAGLSSRKAATVLRTLED